jgi:hypothetical protein
MFIQKVYATSNNVADPLTGRFRSLNQIFGLLLNIVIGVGWALVFIMLALGFIKYITSRGETKATDSARQWLTYAALGGVGLFFLTAIRFIVVGLLGANEANLGTNNIWNFWQTP